MSKVILTTVLISFFLGNISFGQLKFIHYPADTTGWVIGSSQSDIGRRPHYLNDTFVVTTSMWDENNFIYNTMPISINGASSAFIASFDFKMDSSSACSDGLTFWFFTSGLSGLGRTSMEGCGLGFPDTSIGFALSFQTTGCTDRICMKHLNSLSPFYFCSHISDSNICTPLTSQMFLTDGNWHHCEVRYDNANITTTFDYGTVVMTGYCNISGIGHFGFMGTNGGGYSRKCLKNIQIEAGLGTPADSTANFSVYINKQCNGPQLTATTHTYSASHNLTTYFGDGAIVSTGFSSGIAGGYATVEHAYKSPGKFRIKQVLTNGTVPVDSLSFNYENTFCSTLPIRYYYDNNNNCIQDASEPYISQPIVTEVDSNGVPVDTIPSTNGFYYAAKGTPGDIYAFKIISSPGNMHVSCPSSGIVYDTLRSGTFTAPVKYMGLACATGGSFDLAVKAVIPVTGTRDQWGDIYVSNDYCASKDGILTVHFSPQYTFKGNASPAPASVSGNMLTWNLSSLSSLSPVPTRIHYQVDNPITGPLSIGDNVSTVLSLTPIDGDIVIGNNDQIIKDTVRGSCDPNEMSVSPNGCFPSGQDQLVYTINFENTGNDTAFNIYVLDTLSDYLDPRSLRITTASANMNIAIYKSDEGHNIVKFDFPDINLLDSTHHNECNGAVIFSIKTKQGIANGTEIYNRAGIYFDDNDVVMTNTVQNAPVPAITITGAGNVCTGENATLTASAPGGVWSAANPALTVTDGNITGIGAGVDTLVYSMSYTCGVVVLNKIVTVNALPALFIVSGSNSYCAGGLGSAINLSSSQAGVNYQLYNGASAIGGAISGTGGILNFGIPSVSATYSVLATNATSGCKNGMNGTAVVTINPLPTVHSVTGGGTNCAGLTGFNVGLNASDINVNYQLYNGSMPVGGLSGTGANLNFGVFTTSGTYSVLATNSVTSCSSGMSGSASIVVNSLPAVFEVSGGGSYCAGGTGVHIMLAGSELGATYQLYKDAIPVGSAIPGTGIILDMGSHTAAGIYTIQATNGVSCISNMLAAATVNIIPAVIPSLSIYPSAIDTVCYGVAETFFPAVVNGGSSPAYLWKVNGTIVASGSTFNYTPFDGDVVMSVLTSDAICATPSIATASVYMHVDMPPIPVVAIVAYPGIDISQGDTVSFTASVSNGGDEPAYQWFKNSIAIPGATAYTYSDHLLVANDAITCRVMSSSACGGLQSFNTVTLIGKTTGIIESPKKDMLIFPNPAHSVITISAEQIINTITVCDLLGQNIYSKNSNAEMERIDISNLPNGVYFIKINGTNVRKFIKQ